jgi:hypothetical protein
MALVRPRLNDYHGLAFAQEEVDFAIPFLDEDIPLYVDPFLLWKSPSLQDNSLHTALISSFNHLAHLVSTGREGDAVKVLITISECREAGLGVARNKQGHRIGEGSAREILSLFSTIPQVKKGGFDHIEEIQLYVDQVSRDRISDMTCSLLKSFLIDFTIDQCKSRAIPTHLIELRDVFDYRTKTLLDEQVELPCNPENGAPILLVPKRWLRYVPWINYDDFFDSSYVKELGISGDEKVARVTVLNYNRHNHDLVRNYIQQKERTRDDCKNDPLFRPIPVISARRRLEAIQKLPTGKTQTADRAYEDLVCQLMASLLYPQLDFASEQSRTDSGVLIRDLIFYNSKSVDFLDEILTKFESRQIVFELKNVAEVEREHVNQLNRYLADHFGRFGVLVTRNPLRRAIFKNTIDLWAGQRKCIVAITDEELSLMVKVYASKQRLPIEVLKRAYVDFIRACPS